MTCQEGGSWSTCMVSRESVRTEDNHNLRAYDTAVVRSAFDFLVPRGFSIYGGMFMNDRR